MTTPSSIGPPPTSTSPERPAAKPEPHGASGSWTDVPATSEEITRWQQWLEHAGYYAGRPDGVWTDAVANALKKWQVAVGLDASGKIDGETRAKLAEVQSFLSPTSPATAPAAGSGGKPAAGPPAPAAGTTAGGSGAASGTGGAPASGGSATGSTGLGGTPNPDGRFGIPGGGKLWHTPDGWFVVYNVPGTNPPVPLAWKVETDDELKAIFGPNQAPKADRELNADQWRSSGAISNGPSRLLANTSEHPFDAFVANFEREAKIRPWLKDEEILGLTVKAVLENRTVTDAELAGTKWWQNHTASERAWISTYNSDPATAKQKVTDGQDTVRRLMIAAGVDQPPEQLVTLIGNRMTAGTWSQQYVQNQIAKLGDPYAPGALDPTLSTWVQNLANGGTTINTLAGNTSKVDQLIRTWLGPAIGQTVTAQERQQWAGELRGDPNAEERIIQKLKLRRVANYGEFPDGELSYDDIASTARGAVQQMWGQSPDETDPFFQELVRLSGSAGTKDQPGGLAGVQQRLRAEGLARGVGTVVNNSLATLNTVFGGGQRRAI